ncbi:GNAT family N-acetyltransferase [Streptomyces sp. NPDC059639]|uniref:GNAT family N-acetyltransferase n=1 Tax=Streptomyces sp. NPDC059639 TaxID=3346891 RepID=UPI0036B7DE8B
MSDSGQRTWPPAPITTARLVLRESEARDRAAYIELFASEDVGVHVGGARPRADLERDVPEVPGRRAGQFVVERDGAMIGTVEIERRDPEHRSSYRPDVGDAEIGYLFLPAAWGHGYAAEACAAVLDWFDGHHPGATVSLRTQTANTRSLRLAEKLGFGEAGRYEEWGAEQWLGVWSRVSPDAAPRRPGP